MLGLVGNKGILYWDYIRTIFAYSLLTASKCSAWGLGVGRLEAWGLRLRAWGSRVEGVAVRLRQMLIRILSDPCGMHCTGFRACGGLGFLVSGFGLRLQDCSVIWYSQPFTLQITGGTCAVI